MSIDEAIAEARENVERNFSTEPCVIRSLLLALDREREKNSALRKSGAELSIIAYTWRHVWGDKFGSVSVRAHDEAQAAFHAAATDKS